MSDTKPNREDATSWGDSSTPWLTGPNIPQSASDVLAFDEKLAEFYGFLPKAEG